MGTVAFPNIWDIIERFKRRCKDEGWETSEYEDLINAEGKYSYLVWTRHIYPDTFKRVVTNSYQIIRTGNNYRRVKVAYLAWISQESIPEGVLEILTTNPRLLRKVALYDISPVYEGQSSCLRINKTKSPVFQKFERFLKEYHVSLAPIERMSQVSH